MRDGRRNIEKKRRGKRVRNDVSHKSRRGRMKTYSDNEMKNESGMRRVDIDRRGEELD